MIESMERCSSDCSKCLNCMYRDLEISHCWYTVTTNKTNYLDGSTCSHYVNREDALNEWYARNKEAI